MSKDNLQGYIIVFSCIFLMLLFLTWQQITVFRLGYRIRNLQENIRNEEIIKQQYMKILSENWSLSNIEYLAKNSYKMKEASADSVELLCIDNTAFINSEKKKQLKLLAVLKDIFSISEAKAK